ncbi:Heterokaryon incompatibility protein (HET) domain containing protein [Naviculisporaceae sp. PSN 640]
MQHLWLVILSELIVSYTLCSRAVFIALEILDRVRPTMREVLRDSSWELRFVASILQLALELWIWQFIEYVLRGVGNERQAKFTTAFLQLFTVGRKPDVVAAGVQFLDTFKIWIDRSLAGLPYPSSPESNVARYEYARLSNQRAIRLITLDPDEDVSKPIRCRMEEVTLDSNPVYTALSYAWDSDQGFDRVLCDGRWISVTRNCVAALNSFRGERKRQTELVWVDAICINQDETKTATEEKRHQIGIMGEIYKKASSVRVWLGNHDESSILVYKFFSRISGDAEQGEFQLDPERKAETIGLNMAREWPSLSKSLADFFLRSWFTRAWPIQEVTLPSPGRVEAVCGVDSIPLEYIRAGWEVLKTLGILPASSFIDQAVALQFYLSDAIALKRRTPLNRISHRPLISNLSEFSFTAVMNSMRWKECRDPKDRFFSLYGVFRELGTQHDIPLSMWSEPDAEVFQAVALACFKLDGGRLNAIRLARLPEPYLRLSDFAFLSSRRDPYDALSNWVLTTKARTGRLLMSVMAKDERKKVFPDPSNQWSHTMPSWVPDWTWPIVSGQTESFGRISLLEDIGRLPAALPSPVEASHRRVTTQRVKGSRLYIEAKVLGKISEIGTVDPIRIYWQLSSTIRSRSRRHQPTSPDPLIAALIDSTLNFTLRSYITQVYVSLRMAFSTLDIWDVMAYLSAAYSSRYFSPLGYKFLCTRMPSVASCATNGVAPGREEPVADPFTTIKAIEQAVGVFIRGRTDINRDLWRQSCADVLFTTAGVFWKFRVSITESLFGRRYDDPEMQWSFVMSVLGKLMAWGIQTGASFMGDTSLFLLGWSLGALSKLGLMAAAVVVLWRIMLPPFVMIFSVYIYRSPARLVKSVFALGWFREPRSDTQGVHFFATDTGITGSTGGAALSGDCLAEISGMDGYMVLRRKDRGFVVVGAAYVGTAHGAARIASKLPWEDMELL